MTEFAPAPYGAYSAPPDPAPDPWPLYKDHAAYGQTAVHEACAALDDRTAYEEGGAHPETEHPPAAGPVFVDSSGRRLRRVRRLGQIVVVLAAGYLALMVSTALGGPTTSSPFLPLPAPPKATAERHTPAPMESRTATGSDGTAGSGGELPKGAANAARSGSTTPSSAAPTASPSPSASANASASPSPGRAGTHGGGNSRASTAPGSSHRPAKS
jgi:hypothetical protein